MLERFKEFSQTDKVAASYDGDVITYNSLYKRAQALAWFLKDNTDLNKPIAIYGDKENDMIVAFFASVIIKKTYVALPSVYPKEKLNLIIEDCEPDIIFNATNNKYNYLGINEINAHDVGLFIKKYDGYKELLYEKARLDKTALIIYTSGSTGEPKGVEISYQNLESHIIMDKLSTINLGIEEGEECRVLNVTSYGFVACLNVFYLYGFAGCRVLSLPSNKLIDTNYISSQILEFCPNFFAGTPSLFRSLLTCDTFNENNMPFLKKIILAGEPLNKNLVIDIKKKFKNIEICNIYGSTETAGIGSVCYANKELLDADEEYMPVDDGRTGLLKLIDENGNYITKDNELGECVFVNEAAGKRYYKNKESTKEKFVDLNNKTRGFKMGDVGYRKNGYIYLKGRIDNLVKIGGNRVEIEDVEANLLKCSIVNEAAVISENKNDINSLTALVSLKENYKNINNGEAFISIKKEMLNRVERYKIPQKIIILDSLPKNDNGKIDKKELKSIIGNN